MRSDDHFPPAALEGPNAGATRATAARDVEPLHEFIPALADRYRVERELGAGGMATVYLAQDLRHSRQVAVKVLREDLTASLGKARFLREITIAAGLTHPHILPLLDSGEASGRLFYVMPYVDGPSLRQKLSSGELPIDEAVRILRDVAEAMAHAHRHGVVHRDIKPENVMISGRHALVLDFGVAKALSEATGRHMLTTAGVALGTPHYMSPEQATADPHADHRSDIYSFGVLAYELLTGRPPFMAASPMAVLAAHATATAEPISHYRGGVPPALETLVMRCLEKIPADRWQSAEELIPRLEALLTPGNGMLKSSTQPVPARPTQLAGDRTLRRALLLYAGAFAAVALLARVAQSVIGLPDWVFPGALVVMLLGLPAILLTDYIHRVAAPVPTPGERTRPQGTLEILACRASPHVTWGRTAIGVGAALGAFATLIGVSMTLRALGIGPEATLLSSGKLKQRERVVLTDFRVTSADSSLGRVVSDLVRQGLSESSAITLLSPTTISAALGRMQRAGSVSFDLPLAREVSLREGVKAIVDGDVVGVGNAYIVTLRIVTADSANLLASLSATGDGPKGLIEATDQATRALRAKLGESLRRVQGAAPLSRVATSPLEALRKYSEAYHAFLDDPVRAIALLREATALDSSFAMAWRLLGTAMRNQGMSIQERNLVLERAFRLRDHLPERERLRVEYSYYWDVRPDREKAIAACEALMAVGDTAFAAASLGILYESRREFARADTAFARSRRFDPEYGVAYLNAVVPLVELGRMQDAAKLTAAARERFPTSSSLPRMLLLVGYHLGRVAELRRAADTLSANPNRALQSWAFHRLKELELRDGHPNASERLFTRARAADSARGVLGVPLADSVMLARIDVVVRDSAERAIRLMDAALAAFPLRSIAVEDRPYFAIANLYAIAGLPGKARAILDQYMEDVPDRSAGDLGRREGDGWGGEGRRQNLHTVAGEIALAEHRFKDALAEFRRGDSLADGPANECTICLPASLARAFDGAGQSDSAIVMYERYLQTPHFARYVISLDPSLLAGTHERLGQLYEAKGDTAKSAEHFQAFIALWKDADPELQPRVAEARRRLARLRRGER